MVFLEKSGQGGIDFMRKPKRQIARQKFQQFDTSLKGWVKDNPAHIIPVLLPGATFQEALDIEAIKPTMRADRVFKVLYKDRIYILNIEFESGSDEKMRARLLAYNAILHLEYEIPVISLIVYPFRTTVAESPLVLLFGNDELLRFHFRVLPLFKQEADKYMQEHLTCMYPLLPSMRGTNREVIISAMAELKALYREDEVSLAQQLVWMEVLLERTTTISAEEKIRIQEGIKMYDPLWEEHPKVKKIKAEAKATVEQAKIEARTEIERARIEAKAKAEAEARAEVERARAEVEAKAREASANTLREDVVKIVQVRFPDLADLAQQAVAQIANPDNLNFLLVQVASAANETAARYILHPSAA
jgi:hypothetical protein